MVLPHQGSSVPTGGQTPRLQLRRQQCKGSRGAGTTGSDTWLRNASAVSLYLSMFMRPLTRLFHERASLKLHMHARLANNIVEETQDPEKHANFIGT